MKRRADEPTELVFGADYIALKAQNKLQRWRDSLEIALSIEVQLKKKEAELQPTLSRIQGEMDALRKEISNTHEKIYRLAGYIEDAPLQERYQEVQKQRRLANEEENKQRRDFNRSLLDMKDQKRIKLQEEQGRKEAFLAFKKTLECNLGPSGDSRIHGISDCGRYVTLRPREPQLENQVTKFNILDKGEGNEDATHYYLDNYLENPEGQTFEAPPPEFDPEVERERQEKVRGDADKAKERALRASRFREPPQESDNQLIIHKKDGKVTSTVVQLKAFDSLPATSTRHANPRMALAFDSAKAQTRMIVISDVLVPTDYLERDYAVTESSQHNLLWTQALPTGQLDYYFESIHSPQAIPVYAADTFCCELLYLMNDWSAWVQFKTLEPSIQLLNQLNNYFNAYAKRTAVTLECLKVCPNKLWTGMIVADSTMQLSYYSDEPFVGTRSPPVLLAQFQFTAEPAVMADFLLNANADLVVALQAVNNLAASMHDILVDRSRQKDYKVWNATESQELLGILDTNPDLALLAQIFGGSANAIRRIAKIRPDILRSTDDNYSLVYDILGAHTCIRTSAKSLRVPLFPADSAKTARYLYDANKHGYHAPLLDPVAQREIVEQLYEGAAARRDARLKDKGEIRHAEPFILQQLEEIQQIPGPLYFGTEADSDL